MPTSPRASRLTAGLGVAALCCAFAATYPAGAEADVPPGKSQVIEVSPGVQAGSLGPSVKVAAAQVVSEVPLGDFSALADALGHAVDDDVDVQMSVIRPISDASIRALNAQLAADADLRETVRERIVQARLAADGAPWAIVDALVSPVRDMAIDDFSQASNPPTEHFGLAVMVPPVTMDDEINDNAECGVMVLTDVLTGATLENYGMCADDELTGDAFG